MSKRFFIIPILLLLCQDLVWAQRNAQTDDRAARRQFEEDQRADEYALSLRRRDWLKDRLILEVGMGTKFPVMGANWLGMGAGIEYITRWHFSGFLTAGFVPSHDDPVMEGYTLDGGMGWRVGMAYYMFPKSPIHLGFQVSYGTVYYDHRIAPEGFDPGNFNSEEYYGDLTFPIVMCKGYEFDIFVSYLSNQWFYGQIMVGMYYIGNGLKDNPNGSDGSSGWGMTNPSWEKNHRGEVVSVVTKTEKYSGIPPYGVVFGVGIGFAFEELFPDDTEIRRRERETGRPQARPASRPAAGKQQSRPANRPAPVRPRVVEDYDDEDDDY